MRLDSRARTSARRRRGISKGFATLAINAVTAHHAADATLQNGRSFASLLCQHVSLVAPPTLAAGAPQRPRRRRAQRRRTPHPQRSQRIQRRDTARARPSVTVNEYCAGRLSRAATARRKRGRARPSKPAYPTRCQPTLPRIKRPMRTSALETMLRNVACGTA